MNYIHLFILIIILIFSINLLGYYELEEVEPFLSKKVMNRVEKYLCYGWFFKIKIPIINIKIKLCIPGLALPIPLNLKFPGRRGGEWDCTGVQLGSRLACVNK